MFGRKFKVNASPDVRIILPQHVYHKMWAYAKVSDGEISGFGRTKVVRHQSETIVTILDVRIFKQVVNPVHTELDKEALADFYYSLVKEGENPGKWNLWWHSHNTFNVFFSGTDDATIDRLSKNSHLYSICINKKGDLTGRYDAFGEKTDATIHIESQMSPSMLSIIRNEVKEKVRYSDTFSSVTNHRILTAAEHYGAGVEDMDFDEPGVNHKLLTNNIIDIGDRN